MDSIDKNLKEALVNLRKTIPKNENFQYSDIGKKLEKMESNLPDYFLVNHSKAYGQEINNSN